MKVDREEKKKAVTLKECKKESLNLLSRSLSFYNSVEPLFNLLFEGTSCPLILIP